MIKMNAVNIGINNYPWFFSKTYIWTPLQEEAAHILAFQKFGRDEWHLHIPAKVMR